MRAVIRFDALDLVERPSDRGVDGNSTDARLLGDLSGVFLSGAKARAMVTFYE